MLAIDYAEQFTNIIPYVFGGSRRNADNGTDCSGLVSSALFNVHSIPPNSWGTWTGDMWGDRTETRIIWEGTTHSLPWDEMQRGDLIFVSPDSPDFGTGGTSHVGFYTGNPDAPYLSHFATPGPRITGVDQIYADTKYYGVKRILCEEEEMIDYDELADKVAERVWNFEQNGTLMRDRIQGTDEAANACREQLTRTDDVSGRGTEANMYERTCWLGAAVKELEE